MTEMFKPIKSTFIQVDEWIMRKNDIIVTHTKGWMIIPITKILRLENCEYLDRFSLSAKKGYNSEKSRIRVTKYINYFLKFYDEEKELIYIYYKIKTIIDCYSMYYDEERFIQDLCKYFLSVSMHYKINEMNNDNYCIRLAIKNKYTKEELQYSDEHGKLLLKLSLIIKLIMPLVTHYMYKRRIADTKGLLLKVYDRIIAHFDNHIDIYNKLYETAISAIENNKKNNPIWGKQEIRGINPALHAADSVKLILTDIIIKYEYSQNIVIMNFQTIKRNIGYKITDNNYEYDFKPLSSVSDENITDDNNVSSQFDRFENTLTKENEALYIQNNVNCEQTMNLLSYKYPMEKDEIIFYVKELSIENEFVINPFQKLLIFLLFDNVFGDTVSIDAINRIDYVKLIIIAKRVLLKNGLKILPYILGGKVVKLSERKDINTKQKKEMESSQMYPIIQEKYKNIKIEELIRGILGTIFASEFKIIDYYNPNINGQILSLIEPIIIEEVLIFISLV